MKRINPFKFGTVVDGLYFTNREKESARIKDIIDSPNHLILISPRRFGKTSLVKKVINSEKRKNIFIDLQLTNSAEDFAAIFLKEIYSIFPFEKIRDLIRNFKVIPSISLNPINNSVEVSFQADTEAKPILKDVFNLAEQLSNPSQRLIVVLDEFQDMHRIGKGLDRILRAIIQNHKNINYIFMGSQESMMKEIFERKESAFYHFGHLMYLDKIEQKHFCSFIAERLRDTCIDPETIATEIVGFTQGHPYYSQQLAYLTWNLAIQGVDEKCVVSQAITEMVQLHDLDYERLWLTLNKTDKKILVGISIKEIQPLSIKGAADLKISSASTIFSALKRLMKIGYIYKSKNIYEIDDPFFKQWIISRRQ